MDAYTNSRLARELGDSDAEEEAARRLTQLPDLPHQVSNNVSKICGLGYSGTKVIIDSIDNCSVRGQSCPECSFPLVKKTVHRHPERASDVEYDCLACGTDIEQWHRDAQEPVQRRRR